MQLKINGQSRNFTSPLNVAELLSQLQLTPERVVVELNRNILTADHHPATLLQNGDSLELIQFVGGG
jgi:sulfur carrier protein